MDTARFSSLAERLMHCPVAPGHEQIISAEIEKICLENKLACRRDRFGNLLVALKTNPSLRPLALAAHMDHPGFHLRRRLHAGTWLAEFRGGVPEHYFLPGIPVRLMPGRVPAVLGRATGKHKQYELSCQSQAASGQKFAFAVWDLADFELKNERIYSRACDDLAGVAVVLATLIELRRVRARVNVLGLLSRAEEVGFYGALTLAVSGEVPKNALVVSLETSAEIPPVKMGQGVVLRVGDKASIFDSEATRFLNEVCLFLQKKRLLFKFQRALMSGGTCEATAYQHHGFQTAGLSMPLGNYHNCGGDDKIAPEFVDVRDACGMVELLTAAACQMPAYSRLVQKLPKRLDGLLKKARTLLKPKPCPET